MNFGGNRDERCSGAANRSVRHILQSPPCAQADDPEYHEWTDATYKRKFLVVPRLKALAGIQSDRNSIEYSFPGPVRQGVHNLP